MIGDHESLAEQKEAAALQASEQVARVEKLEQQVADLQTKLRTSKTTITRLEKEISRLREQLSTRSEHREGIIDRRLREILGEPDPLRW